MKHSKKLSFEEIDILKGLKNTTQKTINSKFFYNKRGSVLFEKITKQAEYYPTKTEVEILKKQKLNISKLLPEEATIIEFGSGSNRKITNFIKALKQPKKYFPVDISREYLLTNSKQFAKAFPEIKVEPICMDFVNIKPYEKKKIERMLKDSDDVIGFFPGSTIGNFEPNNAQYLLKNFSRLLEKKNHLVIGVDLLKKKEILESAYNDKSGYTAEFNTNVLKRLNKEFNANFNFSEFKHYAFFNKFKSRIEMHLVSKVEQSVEIFNEKILFKKGESIHTENSYKYSTNKFDALISKSGFKKKCLFTDNKKYFAIYLLQVI